MEKSIPKGKIKRAYSTGKIAAEMGKNQLGFFIKKPFLSTTDIAKEKQNLDDKNAAILFNGLSLLRGTALKAAQFLSFESDAIPESFRKELEKSYNQVPPINRALVRKIIQTNFNLPPEKLFRSFDTKAFAAASLGQVHKAVTNDGEPLAVKIQYPDISKTISNDITLFKTAVRPMAQYELFKTALDEIEEVLIDETDYEKEAANINYFASSLAMDNVVIPKVFTGYTTQQVLSMSMLKGDMLAQWLESDPKQEQKNQVAQTLHDIFIRGFYELHVIHADPNPGNFIVFDGLNIGLLDFGCVKSFDKAFIDLYKKLVTAGKNKKRRDYIELLKIMKIVSDDLDKRIVDELADYFVEMGQWFYKLYAQDEFDFRENYDFIEKGKLIGQKIHNYRKYIKNFDPNFIFLDRTRYGLMRLFEKMNAKIKIRNTYECG